MIPLPAASTLLRFAPYAAILGLCLALWTSINWGQGHKVAREAAEGALITMRQAYTNATQEANNLKKERENAIQQAITEAREIERQAAEVNDRRLRAAVAAERRDAAGLRDQLAASLGRACSAAQDPAAAGDEAAAAIGGVLAEALRLQAEATAAAEGHAGEVRALLDAWPGR